jgi:hypothetical protein
MVLIVMGLDMDQFGEREKTRQDLLSLSLWFSLSLPPNLFSFLFLKVVENLVVSAWLLQWWWLCGVLAVVGLMFLRW